MDWCFVLGLVFAVCHSVAADGHFILRHPKVRCDEQYMPEYCIRANHDLSFYLNVEDFENCAPGLLPLRVRNYYLGSSGYGLTYRRNLGAYKRIAISRRVLRDVSQVDLSTTILGHKISVPYGLSPVAAQGFANPEGESGSARAAARFRTVMMLSSESTTSLEEVAWAAASVSHDPVLFMQTYIYQNRSDTIEVVRRAEAAGYKAIVLTVDREILGRHPCGGHEFIASNGVRYPNVPGGGTSANKMDLEASFQDIRWLRTMTNLPIVIKGIVSGEDAVMAAKSGASAIMVSNHGGREMESEKATIDSLPEVVQALLQCCPSTEVYIDGGVRSGFDVYKALARGARAVFFGRPIVWGLAVAGEKGVRKVLEIMRRELNETMILAGTSKVDDIHLRDHSYRSFIPEPFDVDFEQDIF